MSAIASVVERTRNAFASVSRLEAAVSRAPHDRALQLNLAAANKLAQQSQDQLFAASQAKHIEVCTYRLVPATAVGFSLPAVSKSLLEYQNLFSQIYDAKKNGPKTNAVFGDEALQESLLDFGYSYSGSLGVVLLAHSDQDFFGGKLDPAIEALFQVLDIDSRDAVRDVARVLGTAVVKRIHDWSQVNIQGGFAADVRWSKSDGRQLGEVIERRRMETIVDIISATSDETTKDIVVVGRLIGADLSSETFHFQVVNGEGYRGQLAKEFNRSTEMILGKQYSAHIRETQKTVYSTEKLERKQELVSLLDESPVQGGSSIVGLKFPRRPKRPPSSSGK
jgi:hypothetical protein